MRPQGDSRGGSTTSSNVWGIGIELVLNYMCLMLGDRCLWENSTCGFCFFETGLLVCFTCENVGTDWSMAEQKRNIGEPGSKRGVVLGERMMET